jgi:sugar phosphate isomerase/epimerase
MARRWQPVGMLSLAHLTVLDAHPLELIDAALAGGFDTLGLRIVEPMATDTIVPVIGDESLIRAIEERLDATGRRIFDIEAVWLMPHTDVDALEPALALGSRFGAKYLLVVGNDPDPGRLAANFGGLCDLADSYGIKIALEPIPYVELGTPAQGLALLNNVQKPNARLLIDALHLYRSGSGPAALAGIDPALFPYIHLCDAALAPPAPDGLRAEGRGGRFYPGEGELPLGAFLRAFPANIPIGVEAPCARYAHLPVQERARICGAATRALLSGLRAA